MRRMIGTVGATLAIAATLAVSAAPADAQTAIEYALMSGFGESAVPAGQATTGAPEFGFDVSAQRGFQYDPLSRIIR